MSQQPETRFKIRVRKLLESIPGSYWIKIQQRSIRGIPDFLGLINGRFIAIELKVGKNKVKKSGLQQYVLNQIKAAGGVAYEMNPDNYEFILADLHKLAA